MSDCITSVSHSVTQSVSLCPVNLAHACRAMYDIMRFHPNSFLLLPPRHPSHDVTYYTPSKFFSSNGALKIEFDPEGLVYGGRMCIKGSRVVVQGILLCVVCCATDLYIYIYIYGSARYCCCSPRCCSVLCCALCAACVVMRAYPTRCSC